MKSLEAPALTPIILKPHDYFFGENHARITAARLQTLLSNVQFEQLGLTQFLIFDSISYSWRIVILANDAHKHRATKEHGVYVVLRGRPTPP
jgi:hypothetical protein